MNKSAAKLQEILNFLRKTEELFYDNNVNQGLLKEVRTHIFELEELIEKFEKQNKPINIQGKELILLKKIYFFLEIIKSLIEI